MNPEIILGSPGCGKTETLLSIVDDELHAGTPPSRIGFVSFTKRATAEAVQRACEKFRLDARDLSHFRTLHSMCFRQLAMRREDVLQGARLKEFARFAGVTLTGRAPTDGSISGLPPGDRALFLENLARVRMRSLRQEFDEDCAALSWAEVDYLGRALADFKAQRGLSDFTDMLARFAHGGPDVHLDVLIGDECQDMSTLQWKVFKRLANGCRRVVLAGDDDQAIYAPWAGADVEQFINLPGQVRALGQSHRVPRAVQDLALDVIAKVAHRRPKAWAARAAQGQVDRALDARDIDADGPDVLVLARNNYILTEQVEPELRSRGVYFEREGKLSIDPRLLAAVQDWESLRAGQTLVPERAKACFDLIGNVVWQPAWDQYPELAMADLGAPAGGAVWHEALRRIPPAEAEYMRAARARGEKLRDRPRVRLSTIHSAKGAQADHVILFSEMALRTRREADLRPDDEARVFYVGVTRAKERLTLVESQSPDRYRL
jgi:DNA helicase-2/ATP-dependent DNA helicase PcrA